MIKISNRLHKIFSKIAPYTSFCDVGCDHGYLEVLALQSSDYHILAVDNKEGPINSCKSNVKMYAKYTDNIEYSLSSGLDELTPKYNCVTICGMGTELICDIIQKNIDKTSYIDRFIIDSHRNISDLRVYMSKIGYGIVDEELIYENDIYYEIITFEKSDKTYSDIEYYFGPLLLQNKNEVFYQKYNALLQSKKLILSNIKDNNNPKYKQIENEIKLIESVL